METRIGQTSETVLKSFKNAWHVTPTAYTLSDEERRQLSEAFAALPPLHQRVLRERLRSISFVEGIPNSGLTYTIESSKSDRVFDIVIRAGVLHQTLSEWMTEKECRVFDAAGSSLRVSIEAGKRNALLYVLLHEATHVVDATLGITSPAFFGKASERRSIPTSTAFTVGIWVDYSTITLPYRDALRERIRFYVDRTLPINQAPAVYVSLQKTPFVSLYGSGNRADDLAEYVAVYHWTQVLKEPYRIVLRDGKKVIFTYEPMQSPLVRGRISQMQQFYE